MVLKQEKTDIGYSMNGGTTEKLVGYKMNDRQFED